MYTNIGSSTAYTLHSPDCWCTCLSTAYTPHSPDHQCTCPFAALSLELIPSNLPIICATPLIIVYNPIHSCEPGTPIPHNLTHAPFLAPISYNPLLVNVQSHPL